MRETQQVLNNWKFKACQENRMDGGGRTGLRTYGPAAEWNHRRSVLCDQRA